MALLHKPSIMRLYRTEEADPALIAAVVALASRLPGSSVEEMRVGLQCSEITRDLVDGSLGKPSLYRMQALVLLLHFQLWTGSSNDPLLLTAHLARCAFLLGLNREMGHAACHVQESRRRLMWSIYLLDVGLADGLQEYTVCPAATLHLRLPCMEDDFELGNESNSVGLRDAPGERLGIIAYYIRIISLHDDILR